MWGLLDPSNPSKRTFVPEFHPRLKHTSRGTVSMATVPSKADPDHRPATSQFLITLGDSLEYLDGKAAVFGHVAEGFDTLEKINTAILDDHGHPLKDIRIAHTIVVDEENIPDPPGLVEPPESPTPTPAQLATVRIPHDAEIKEDEDPEKLEQYRREREAKQQALTLEMVGDLPFAEVAPPENVLFVCKLNPVTGNDDLEMIFSRFGTILSCEVIKDKRTGDSLQYAFIEFAEQQQCEQAYFKMQDVLIDDHRIHVDFSQSVSKFADPWRNATNKKRSMQARGGFGGIESLEKKRQYRAQGDEVRSRDGRYGMVFDEKGRRRSSELGGHYDSARSRRDGRDERDRSHRDARRYRSRSRSPPRYRGEGRDRLDDRRKQGSPGRERCRKSHPAQDRSVERRRDRFDHDYYDRRR